jgi:hypothetical protein
MEDFSSGNCQRKPEYHRFFEKEIFWGILSLPKEKPAMN